MLQILLQSQIWNGDWGLAWYLWGHVLAAGSLEASACWPKPGNPICDVKFMANYSVSPKQDVLSCTQQRAAEGGATLRAVGPFGKDLLIEKI